MSKFNEKKKGKYSAKKKVADTKNRSGNPAYMMDEKTHLVTSVLTTFCSGDKFYGDTQNEIIEMAEKLCQNGCSEFVAKLAAYARKEFNMRSVSHILAAIVTQKHTAKENGIGRICIKNVVVRPDDMTEIMAFQAHRYGKPRPKSLERGIGDTLMYFNEYELAKYNRKEEFTFKDIIKICHPKTDSVEENALIKKVLDDDLKTPYTWETELSAKGNTKEVWNELIKSNKVGYMALLRNLRNIIKSGADIEPVLDVIADRNRVRKAKQLPFRFYSAYIQLKNAGITDHRVYEALEKAINYSIDDMIDSDKTLNGKTMVAIDVSGSMSSKISRNSDIRSIDIGILMGIICSRICEDATVVYFDSEDSWGIDRVGYRFARYGKYDSILDTIANFNHGGGGTDLTIPIRLALGEANTELASRPYDRVIYISDNEMNADNSYYTSHITRCQQYVNEYRKRYNKDLWVHGIDTQGYGTQQFYGDKFNIIAGWSEKCLDFIKVAEEGTDNLVKAIEAYKLR